MPAPARFQATQPNPRAIRRGFARCRSKRLKASVTRKVESGPSVSGPRVSGPRACGRQASGPLAYGRPIFYRAKAGQVAQRTVGHSHLSSRLPVAMRMIKPSGRRA
jgi:hypothetical protein